jgi:proteasome lid subunit RPN8/RPN11
METPGDSSLTRWTVPECPFAIEYVPRVLDDIRLAVVDAFFSLPRGGAEIGGILLGRREKGRVVITDSAALECEHAFGPSFVLSDADRKKLAELIAAHQGNPEAAPVGWYHSHTRSEIFLSDADLEIHQRFFPEPWQVAAVLKPHTFLPTRAGFFFRENGGTIRAEASYREIELEPLPMGKLPTGNVIDLPAAEEPEPAPVAPPPAPDIQAPPSYAAEPPPS